MLYLAHGSNMSSPRLLARVPGARRVAVVRLDRHARRFHKPGRDGTGKCDALYTGRAGDWLAGVVFHIPESGLHDLDRAEGLGAGYERKNVRVQPLEGGGIMEAVTYYATARDPALLPLHWYRYHVLAGAVEHGLPPDQVRAIQEVPSLPDPDQARHERELAIYGPRPPIPLPDNLPVGRSGRDEAVIP